MIPQAPVDSDHEVRSWFAAHVIGECELWVAENESASLAGLLVLDGPRIDQLDVESGLTGCGIGSAILRLAKRERPAAAQAVNLLVQHRRATVL